MSTTLSQAGAFCRGRPSRIVATAFAWISGPGIRSSPNETGWTSCSEGAHGPTTTILPRKRPGSNCPRKYARERDGRNRPDRAVVVDEPVLHREPLDGLAGRTFGGDDTEALQAVELERDAPDDPARVVVEVPVADRRAGVLDAFGAAEEVRLAVLADLGGREDDVACRAGGVHEGVVLLGVGGGLAELDVVGDHFRAVLLQPRDQPSVIRARERPLQVQLVEGDVVDLHDGEILGRRLLAAHRETRVDRVEVEVLEDVHAVRDQPEAGRAEPDGEEEGDAQTPATGGHPPNSG